MEAHFFQIGDRIFQLEQVSHAEYSRVSKEDAERFSLPTTRLFMHMANGDEVWLGNEDADQVWGLLKASALNITPKPAVDGE